MSDRREFIKVFGAGVAGLAGGYLAGALSAESKVAEVPSPAGEKDVLRAAWIYISNVEDFGWTYAHDLGRRYVAERLDFLETEYVESVPENESLPVITQLVNEGYEVIFTTSFGYMDDTIEAGKRYPDRIFMHCSGYKRRENVGTYFVRMYQPFYLTGLAAGAVTESNKLGYVAAHPIPEVIRHINAFHLGARRVNPDVETYVIWINAWFNPEAARAAAEQLIGIGCDVLAFTEDTPTVLQVAEENGVYSFSHYSDMSRYGPNAHLTGHLANWGVIYEDVLIRAYTGVWESKDYWWGFYEGAVEISPISDVVPEEVKEEILRIRDLMVENSFEPFTGPLVDRRGRVRAEPGRQLTKSELLSMKWFLEGVVGDLPGEE